MFCFPWRSPASSSRPDHIQPSGTTMPEQQQPTSQFGGNRCNMADVMRRISLAKPPVDMGMYRTLYMMDYQPYSDSQDPHARDVGGAKEKLSLEAQLRMKEFTRPVEKEPVKYAEEPACQEVRPPYPIRLDWRAGRDPGAPPPPQLLERAPQEDFTAAPPHAPNRLLQEPPCMELMASQGEEPQRPDDAAGVPRVRHEMGQNWDNYQQFILETQRASQTQAQEIKKLGLGCSVFRQDYVRGTGASTYQKDYKPWLRVHRGFCRAHRNFSNLLLEDGYYDEDPWMSEYMDNYSIFLQKLNWKLRNPVSSFCSAPKPVPCPSHGMPSQTPVAL